MTGIYNKYRLSKRAFSCKFVLQVLFFFLASLSEDRSLILGYQGIFFLCMLEKNSSSTFKKELEKLMTFIDTDNVKVLIIPVHCVPSENTLCCLNGVYVYMHICKSTQLSEQQPK